MLIVPRVPELIGRPMSALGH